MLRTSLSLRPLIAAPLVAALLALSALGTTPSCAQAGGYLAEIKRLEVAERRVTLKASMGEMTVRVAPDVALDAIKPGDKVLITFGQDGGEPVITRIEPIKR